MNVLVIGEAVSSNDGYGHAKRLHMDFLLRLGKYVKLRMYGPGMQKCMGRKMAPYTFNKFLLLDDVVRNFKANVVIVYSYSSVHRWHILGWRHSKVPKVVIEVDYWYWKTKRKACSFWEMCELVIQRGYYPQSCKNSVWLPFSADEKFGQLSNNRREKEIVFVGQHRVGKPPKSQYYRYRTNILNRAQKEDAKLIKMIGFVGYKNYLSILNKYKYFFCDAAGTLHSPLGKVFEIMAAGGLLLSNRIDPWRILFGDVKPYVEFRDDLSNFFVQARKMKTGEYDDLLTLSRQVVLEKHMHKHRVLELLSILEAVVEGKTIPKKWEV